MKRISRDCKLTPDEAARYEAIREQVTAELPELIARHHERMASLDQLAEKGTLQGTTSIAVPSAQR